MTSPRDILRTGTVLKSKYTFSNHLACIGANDVHAQNLVRLGLSEDLDETIRVQIRLGAGIGHEAKLADFVLDAFSLEVLLRLADPGYLWVGVNNGWNGSVVDVSMATLEELDGSDTLFLSFVCKHGAKGHITDAFDVLLRRCKLVIDDDTPFVIELNTSGLKVQSISVRPSADSHKNYVGLELLRVIN